MNPGDKILAYQTDINSLVGLTVVDRWSTEKKRRYVYLRPLVRLGRDGVRVRPMKTDERITSIPAFKTRQVKTLYDIASDDAEYILNTAKSECQPIEFGES